MGMSSSSESCTSAHRTPGRSMAQCRRTRGRGERRQKNGCVQKSELRVCIKDACDTVATSTVWARPVLLCTQLQILAVDCAAAATPDRRAGGAWATVGGD